MTVEQAIKAERLRQLELSNRAARLEAGIRAGRYMLVDEAKQDMGRELGRLLATFESSFSELASALASAFKGVNQRDVLHTMRSTWQEIRRRRVKALRLEVAAMPAMFDDGANDAACERRTSRA
jgi:hypothetical protein